MAWTQQGGCLCVTVCHTGVRMCVDKGSNAVDKYVCGATRLMGL
jgi:hypothetical protein